MTDIRSFVSENLDTLPKSAVIDCYYNILLQNIQADIDGISMQSNINCDTKFIIQLLFRLLV